MGVPDVMSLSLGQWVAIVAVWNKENGAPPAAPTDEEFDRMIMGVV